MTPEKLRDLANMIECKGALSTKETAEHYRAHAAALEEIERLKALVDDLHENGTRLRLVADGWKELSEQAERMAERLKGHAEAMANAGSAITSASEIINGNELADAIAAYRADKGE